MKTDQESVEALKHEADGCRLRLHQWINGSLLTAPDQMETLAERLNWLWRNRAFTEEAEHAIDLIGICGLDDAIQSLRNRQTNLLENFESDSYDRFASIAFCLELLDVPDPQLPRFTFFEFLNSIEPLTLPDDEEDEDPED